MPNKKGEHSGARWWTRTSSQSPSPGLGIEEEPMTANPSAKPMPKIVSFQNPLPQPQRYLRLVQTKTIKAPQTITAAVKMKVIMRMR